MGVPRRLAALDPEGVARAAASAAAAWRSGRLVAFPTETVYGLGAAARDPAAVRRVFEAKGRPADHPLIVHLAAADLLPAWAAAVPDDAWRLAHAFWPGPLTLVLARRSDVPPEVTGGQSTIALRVPAHPVARALLVAYGDGVAAPSANRFGRVSPTSADHVIADLAHVPDLLVVDGGACDVGLESTIVSVGADGPRILRLGGVSADSVARALGWVDATGLFAVRNDAPRVPGALARHYAPATPTRAVPSGAGATAPPDVAVLARSPAPAGRAGAWRALGDDPVVAARELYGALRELDAAGARELWLEAVPDGPEWAAVADRLARAAARDPLDPEEAA